MLDGLRTQVSAGMSQKRLRHTLEVEKMVSRLAALFCPEKNMMLRAAALLHDTTKEYENSAHIEILEKNGQKLTDTDLLAPKTFHARTAALLIPEKYTEFADSELISCVRWHTTGREDMTLPEKLLYLADYIDESRVFPDCVRLRNYFWGAKPENMDAKQLEIHLLKTMIMSYDMTISGLIGEGTPVSPDTMLSRNAQIIQLSKFN